MKPICTTTTVRTLDASVIGDLGQPGRVLMELAGRGAADAIHARWPDARVAVACGPGNNGGDGYVVARWLRVLGHAVACVPVVEARSPDAVANRDLARRVDLPFATLDEALADADLVVDAMLGTGQKSEPRGAIADAVRTLATCGRPVAAIDLPTGLDADTGQPVGSEELVLPAALTATLGRAKPGLFCEPGTTLAGEVVVVDIGLDLAGLLEEADVRAWMPRVRPGAAKWHRGHVAVRAGRGAAVLAAHGAARAGVGLVTLLAPREEWPAIKGLWPEVILAEPEALDPNRHDAVVLGPGLGLDQGAAVEAIWRAFPGPVVADGDALTLLARDPVPPPAGLVRVLTPHAAEAGRLLGRTRAEVEADRFDAADALRDFGVPLLKGPHSIVGRERTPWVLPFRDERLATAGSGDVLAGLVGGMLARGLPPDRALAVAGWLHGATATRLPRHATASDIVAALPAVVDALLG